MASQVDKRCDLAQREAEPLRRFDHAENGEVLVRVFPVSTGAPSRLGEEAATLVVAQGLHIDPGRVGQLTAAQGTRASRLPDHLGPADKRRQNPRICRWHRNIEHNPITVALDLEREE